MTTDPTSDGEQGRASETVPSEFREFTASIRDLFREIKKLVIFIRNGKNYNAGLIFLTFLLAIGTFTQAIISGMQLVPLRESAESAKNAADAARRELELSQRPSVSLTDIQIIGPLVFDSNVAHTLISYAFTNIGHSPAIDGVDLFDFMAPYADTPNPVKKRDDLCNTASIASGRVRAQGIGQLSKTWFPGQPEPMTFNISWNINDITKAMTDIPKQMFPESTNPLPDFFMPTMVVCIAYRPSFTEAQYHTGYILQLVHKKTFMAPKFMERGEIPADELQFVFHPFWGVYAD